MEQKSFYRASSDLREQFSYRVINFAIKKVVFYTLTGALAYQIFVEMSFWREMALAATRPYPPATGGQIAKVSPSFNIFASAASNGV